MWDEQIKRLNQLKVTHHSISHLTGITPFFRIIFPYLAVSPVTSTRKADLVLS